MVLSLPSPGDPYLFHLGGFAPTWYGLLLGVAGLAAFLVTRRQLARRGLDAELLYPVVVCAVPLGIVGARAEHVAVDWMPFSENPQNIVAVWHAGLGIYGGVIGGMIGAVIGCRIARLPFWTVADCAAPGLVLAQAIGRLGNYTNQELYGHASNLPWAIRIQQPVPPYLPGRAFQPTFAYEAVWDLAVLAVLLWFIRRTANRVRPGTVFALYAGLYSFGRLWIETIRIDHTTYVLGQRVEIWVAAIVAAVATAAFAVLWSRRTTVG